MLNRITYLKEPELIFGNNQRTCDPRDGLILFGPYEKWGTKFDYNSYSISAGVIGTLNELNKYKYFVQEIKKPIVSTKRNKRGLIVSNEIQRPSYPGFEAIFNIHWPENPDIFIEIKPLEIEYIFSQNKNRRIRTSKLVDLYLEKMIKASKGKDARINIWIVIVPKKIFDNCRIQKGYGTDFTKSTIEFFKNKEQGQFSLFTETEMYGEELSQYMDTSSDFHHLLKARANQQRIDAPLQIIVEPKLEFRDTESNIPYGNDMKAFMCWSLSTTIYYKLGKKPWKLADIRNGVCYLGLVFKKFQSKSNNNMVCSAAQLFLSDGDGTVFRGNNGLWIGENPNEHHLDEEESFNLLNLALDDYYENNNESYPKELFIHGRANFSDAEWTGFLHAVEEHNESTKLTGVVIKDDAPLKLFRDVDNEKADFGVMRGIAVILGEDEAYLFTRGFIPRLNTSTSMEIPNPLHIKVTRGKADIETVLEDILKLTKLNYNTCIYGDGKPVTLRFSDTIGNILTATENWKEERRQFQFYI
ncbi:MAG: hypothetical protein JXA68_05725 [Ignavibacteriales bacterium]|nr:hypothetical protein [Ignavibacteriales bacterium]